MEYGRGRTPGRSSHLWRVLLCAVLLGGVAAHVHGAAASTPSTLRIWYGTDDPTEASWAQQLARGFEAQHHGVHVSLTTYGLDDLNAKMQVALNGNNVPDLVYTTPRGPGLPAYVRAGKLLDLSAAARQRGWAARLRPGLLADYNRLLAANGSKRDAGKTYAVPYVIAAVAVLYNQQLFDKLHLRVPRTLSELESTLARVKKAGYTPLGLGNADGWVGDDWYLTMVNAQVAPSALAPVLQLSPSFSFTKPQFRTSAATLQDWANRDYFTRDFGGLDAQDSVEAFFDGKTAMQLVSSTENSQILSLARESKVRVGIFAFPSSRQGQPPVMPQSGYAGWAIPRNAHSPALALDFIDHVTSSATADLLLSQGMLPAHRIDTRHARLAAPFQQQYIVALDGATPGVYLDSAPIPNINATMEANVQLLLQGYEAPEFLTRSLQQVYASHGVKASATRTDGEF